jgi:UDP-N-acetylglucosamine 1-carboxyvinyltransferase
VTEATVDSGVHRLVVHPGNALEGTVEIAGAKNSVLKLLAATVLAEGTHVISNVPQITDVARMCEVLVAMGLRVEQSPGQVVVHRPAEIVAEAPYELVEQMRASIVVLGPLLAACGEARVALPGGDDFGHRPIDLHLKGLEALGVEFTQEAGVVVGRAAQLTGTPVTLEFPSVGATENILMASVRAKGTTVIDNAAREPEIADLAAFLNKMGANVLGAGTSTITVEGVDQLEPAEHSVIPDRIEAATFLAAVGVAGGEIVLRGARPHHMEMFRQKIGEMGVRTSTDPEGLWAMARGRLRSVDVATLPYPGIATDCMPLFAALLCLGDGVGVITENLYGAGRFRYLAELERMGADVRSESHHAVIRGVERLQAAPVRIPDIRAGAALVVAALGADAPVTLSGIDHLDRGYERFASKLAGLGAGIEVVDAG